MQLDPATLLVVSAATTFLVGTLFMASWRQAPESRVLAYWGAAHLVGAAGSAGLALRNQIPDLISVGLANAVVLAAYLVIGLFWAGSHYQHLAEVRGTDKVFSVLGEVVAWPVLIIADVHLR